MLDGLRSGDTLAEGRYLIEKQIGEGACGVVYQALDQKAQEQVAIKMLTRRDAANIYRLKREFRALADIEHPNLVQLKQLHQDGK